MPPLTRARQALSKFDANVLHFENLVHRLRNALQIVLVFLQAGRIHTIFVRVLRFSTTLTLTCIQSYDSAFIGTSMSLTSFKREFNLISANIVSLYQAGCFFGAFIGYPIGYFLGCKWGLFICAVIFNIGAILQVVTNSSTGLGIVYAGRIIVGLGIGIASNLAPIYVAEIAPPAIRGRLIGMYELCWQIGGVIDTLLMLGAPFLIESPRWMMSRDRTQSSLSSLSSRRNLPSEHEFVQREYLETEEAIKHERSLAGAGFFGPMQTVGRSRKLVWRLVLGMSLFAWQNATGINAINYYSSKHPTHIGGAISMYYIGAYIAIAKPQNNPTLAITSLGRSVIAFFYIWTIFYSPTWNGTPWVVGAEFFPQHVRTFTSSCIAASNWLFAFLIARFTPQMCTSMGYGVYLFFFASLMILSVFYVYVSL
ncbi:general substrate transporter [Dendrothele bispora CBS 962.96]|uniref:General substrate transporter n=1 Tax=Dendrothele bispora (strain CBS 962.96) TaxID=1314807 RepID=A0A4S8L9H4_DENBC|nr:general substrate transporter [Dendrothele bispora CBS 962.96]